MATFNKINQFVGDLGDKVHDLDLDVLKIYLSNTAPIATNSVKTDVAEITAENGYTAGGSDISAIWSQTSGTGALTGTDVVWTATGGTVGPFRYVVLYNDTPTAPADPLIGWWDYGTSITLAAGETFTADFGASILTVA